MMPEIARVIAQRSGQGLGLALPASSTSSLDTRAAYSDGWHVSGTDITLAIHEVTDRLTKKSD
jgi:hypothetical protein